MTDVRVERLRFRGTTSGVVGRGRVEQLVAGLDLAPAGAPDRSIFVVRRLDLEAPTRGGRVREAALRRQATERMGELRRRAVSPLRAPDATDGALAVVFADEAELLACLTRDVVADRLGRRWYWTGTVPAAPDRGSALAVAWLTRARWLPAAAGLLSPRERVAAVATLAPAQARAILAAVLAEREAPTCVLPGPTLPFRSVTAGPTLPFRSVTGGPTLPFRSVTGGPTLPFRSVTGGPTLPRRRSYPARSDLASPAQRALAAVLAAAVESPARLASPEFQLQVAEWAAEPVSPLLPVDAGGVVVQRDPARESPPAVAWTQPTYPCEQDQPGGEMLVAPRVRSRCATALYLVNLWPVMDQLRADTRRRRPLGRGRLARGWSLLELLVRALLTEDQAPDDDPLWTCLAELDGRRAGVRPRGRLPAGLVPASADRLRQHSIEASAFAVPGWVVAGRTHVDVEIDIEAIDLSARVAGLDRDPGWVPELGRVVTFHFGSGV
jgi:hypothetical protein